MSYVPVVTPLPTSPRARELDQRLKETIDGFRQDHPEMTSAEVQQALSLTACDAGSKTQAFVVALLVGLLVCGLLGYFFFGGGL